MYQARLDEEIAQARLGWQDIHAGQEEDFFLRVLR
jgi:hypothetical protein